MTLQVTCFTTALGEEGVRRVRSKGGGLFFNPPPPSSCTPAVVQFPPNSSGSCTPVCFRHVSLFSPLLSHPPTPPPLFILLSSPHLAGISRSADTHGSDRQEAVWKHAKCASGKFYPQTKTASPKKPGHNNTATWLSWAFLDRGAAVEELSLGNGESLRGRERKIQDFPQTQSSVSGGVS